MQDKPEKKKRKNGAIKQRESIETYSKIVDLYLAILIIRLNVDGLNIKSKWQSLLDWIKSTHNGVLPTKKK